jgi:predicted transcriptional regulator
MNTKSTTTRQLESVFGPLEVKVLDALWQRNLASCVKDLMPAMPGVAYTTLMTTLDRLFRKGVLLRQKSGRAFFYTPKRSAQELVGDLASSTFDTLLPGGDHASARPILSMFVETVGRDEALLDELEKLVRERRAELKDRAK